MYGELQNPRHLLLRGTIVRIHLHPCVICMTRNTDYGWVDICWQCVEQKMEGEHERVEQCKYAVTMSVLVRVQSCEDVGQTGMKDWVQTLAYHS